VTAGVGYIYETTLADRQSELELVVYTVPPISVPAGAGSGAPAAVADLLGLDMVRDLPAEEVDFAGAVAAILAGAPPERVDEYVELARQTHHAPEASEADGPVWRAAWQMTWMDVLPVELSPLSPASLAGLAKTGGLPAAAGVVAVTTGVVPAIGLLIVGAFGIVLVHAAEGLGEGLKVRLRRWAAGTA
jgi:hypothetical protein